MTPTHVLAFRVFFIKILPFGGIGYARETPQSRERDEKKSPYTRRKLIRSGSRNRRRPSECRTEGIAIVARSANRVGQNGRTPAMRRLFAKRAHCKWHNIAPPERRRIGSTCARAPKVSSRNRGCPFRGYGCGGNPQEGGSIFIIQERGEESPNSGSPINHRRRFIGASGRRGHNTPLLENEIKSNAPLNRHGRFNGA